MTRSSVKRRLVGGVLKEFVLTLLLAGPAVAQRAELWRSDLNASFKRMVVTPIGYVLVECDSGLVAFDPTNGSKLWARSDASEYEIVEGTALAVVRVEHELRVLDLLTGQDQWRFSNLPVSKTRGYVHLPAQGAFLVIGTSPTSDATVVGVSVDSGVVGWRQDSIFADLVGNSKRASLRRPTPPLFDTDTTAILDMGGAGLLRIRLTDGGRLWRVPDSLVDLDKLTAPLTLVDSTLFVAYDKKLAALNATTGAVLWNRLAKFPGPVQHMVSTPSGLVVSGTWAGGMSKRARVFIDLVDVKTGDSRWTTAAQLNGGSPFVLRNDSIYVPINKGFRALELETGKPLVDVSLPDFGGGEEATTIETMDDGDLLLLSAQNLMRVTPAGQVKYSVYLKAPGASFLAKIGSIALTVAASQVPLASTQHGNVQVKTYLNPSGMVASAFLTRYHATVNANKYAYVFTSELSAPDSGPARAGGFDLVRVDKADGKDTGRIRLFDRTPDYVLEPVSGTVVVAAGRELIGYRYQER